MSLKIAIDFDGTLTKGNSYPQIAPPLLKGIEFLKQLREKGAKIYLDTMRSGKELQEAIEWCKGLGLEFDSVGPHHSQFRWTRSTKVHADYSIDDRSLGIPVLYTSLGSPYIDWEKLIPMIEERLKKEGWITQRTAN